MAALHVCGLLPGRPLGLWIDAPYCPVPAAVTKVLKTSACK